MMMIVLLLLISQHASGVEVYEGAESVLLPCQVPADVSRSSTAAVWNHDRLSNPAVHLRLQKSDGLSGQNDLYKSRTSMRVDALQTGDLSLTLRKPTVFDSGNYTCTSRRAGEDLKKIHVQLKVKEPPPPVGPKVLAAVLVTLIPAAAFVLFLCCAYKRMKDREALLPDVVEVPQEKESVLLPLKTTADLPQDVTVEWTLTEPKERKVHVYESGKDKLDKQDQGYRGRTEMDEEPLRTKDLSLTLKPLHLSDSGVYTCTVYKKDGKMLPQKSVTLCVTVPQPEVVNVTEADESVLLPFTTTADLPQDVTVEWTLTEPTERKVHVYESENNQSHNQDQDYKDRTEMKEEPLRTGDFSLTLKHLHLTDSGVYTCTIYNKDGHMLLQKSVTLRVRESVPDIVQVPQGVESVLLPLKTTADLPQDVTVEWRLTKPKERKVHVYKSGKDQPDKHYTGRTEMNKDPLNTKDLSLTLKDLRLTDSGVYACTVYNKDGDMLLQKVVTLHVMVLQVEVVEVTEEEESVLLPFKTTADLHRVHKVYWILTESKSVVHAYYSENNQENPQEKPYIGRTEMNKDPLRTGHLSLTLKDLRLTDSGVYTCTVYNKDGDMLLQKVVTLRVRATLKGTMADMLPCLRRRRAPKPEVKEDVRNTNHEDLPLTAEETV